MHCLNLKNKLWKIGLLGDYSFWGHILAFGFHSYFAYRAVIQRCELLFPVKFLNHINLSQSHQGTDLRTICPSLSL